MEYSVLFYGYYDSGQNEPYLPPPPNPEPYISPLHYKLPLAYVVVILGIFSVYCIAILVKCVLSLSHSNSLSHSLTLSLSHSLTHSLTHTHNNNSVTHSFTCSLTCSLTHSLTHSLTNTHTHAEWPSSIGRYRRRQLVSDSPSPGWSSTAGTLPSLTPTLPTAKCSTSPSHSKSVEIFSLISL